jgi:hypothetical protein
MAIVLSDNIQTNAPKPSDSRYLNITVPYSSCTQVNSCLAAGVRYTGLTVNIAGVEYWYNCGIANNCLVIKNTIGTITGATNLGSGNGTIFTSISSSNIQIKTLSGGTNITLSCNGNYIGINSTGAEYCCFLITGNSSNTGFTINHALSKQFVMVQVVQAASPYATVYTNTQRIDANNVCITFDTAPLNGTNYNILIIG